MINKNCNSIETFNTIYIFFLLFLKMRGYFNYIN
jgi:hypothetical protein